MLLYVKIKSYPKIGFESKIKSHLKMRFHTKINLIAQSHFP